MAVLQPAGGFWHRATSQDPKQQIYPIVPFTEQHSRVAAGGSCSGGESSWQQKGEPWGQPLVRGGLPAPWRGNSKPRPACRGQDIGFLTLVLLPPLKTAAQGPNLAVHFVSAAGKRRFLLHAHNRLQELGGSPAV